MSKILIIEDNKDILYTNRTMLELNGYEVLSAESIGAGKKIFRETGNISLIILDIMLPDGNGLELCREIREDSDVRILFLSALDARRDVIEGFRAGGDDYLEKPYHLEELLMRVKSLTRRKNIGTPVHSFGNIEFREYSLGASCEGRDLSLRQKEYAILKFLCDNPDEFFTAKEIFEIVWGVTDSDSSEIQPFYNTVSSLKEKISETGVEILHEKPKGYRAALKK